MIRIPPKFGSKVKSDNKPRLTASQRLKAFSEKLDYNQKYIKPNLGKLFQLYRHHCTIFMPGDFSEFGVMYYCGEGYGVYQE